MDGVSQPPASSDSRVRDPSAPEMRSTCHEGLAIDPASIGYGKRRCTTAPAFAPCAPHWDSMSILVRRGKHPRLKIRSGAFPAHTLRLGALNGLGNCVVDF